MKLLYPMRPEQEKAHRTASEVLATPGGRAALVAPTGSGKSLIEAALLLDGVTVACPSMDICDGVARSALIDTAGTEAARRKRYEAAGLYTYKRLHSALAAGALTVRRLVLDEGHHATCDTLQEVLGMCPGVSFVLVTATMYRGTPDDTAKLLALVGNNVLHVLTLHEAVSGGRISLPTFAVLPLMDDETISVVGGEFQVRAAEALASSVRDTLVAQIRRDQWDGERWRRPITLVLPGVASVAEFQEAFGDQAVSVLGDTTNRRAIFDQVVAREKLLLQVRAVGEGTDLPLRVMYDASPTMSPSLWMQRVGRVCRPSAEAPPQYVTTCHNLLRHGYLFEGMVPRAAFRDAVTVWGDEFKPSRRTVARAMGLTGFGRFEPTRVRLAAGDTAFLYALTSKGGTTDAAALLVPAEAEPRYYTRTNRGTGVFEEFQPRPGVTVRYERKEYGTWRRVGELPDLTECTSFAAKPLTPPQRQWWSETAERYGLDPDVSDLTAKEFCVLPILRDTRDKLE